MTESGDQRLLLLRAAPQWRGPATVTADAGGGPVTADVRGCGTVLAVLDALGEPREAQTYLVVLTPCDSRELGNSGLARALGGEVRPVHRWDLVADAFGARRLDPRLTGREFRWLAEALLDAQPSGGWRRITGPVLQFDVALSRLAAVRLGRSGDEERIDAAALLDWSRDETRLARFLALRQDEQDGLAGWLEESAGPVAEIVFRLLRAGQVLDAIPFGLAAAVLWGAGAGGRQAVLAARIRAEERFLGRQTPTEAKLRAFGEAAESLTLRWSENATRRTRRPCATGLSTSCVSSVWLTCRATARSWTPGLTRGSPRWPTRSLSRFARRGRQSLRRRRPDRPAICLPV